MTEIKVGDLVKHRNGKIAKVLSVYYYRPRRGMVKIGQKACKVLFDGHKLPQQSIMIEMFEVVTSNESI